MTVHFIDSIFIILAVSIATFFTRILPFLLFSGKRKTPITIQYLGKVLPSAIIGMLIIYCLKETPFSSSPYGTPEIISILLILAVHLWKRNTLLSIATGTITYMCLVQFIFK